MLSIEHSSAGSEKLPQLPIFQIHHVQFGNREQRRKLEPVSNPIIDLAREMEKLRVRLTGRAFRRNDSEMPIRHTLGQIIFQGKPSVIPWLETNRDLSKALDRWHLSSLETDFPTEDYLRSYEAYDLYSRRLGTVNRFGGMLYDQGVSLADLEGMNPALSDYDRGRINRLFMPEGSGQRVKDISQAALLLVAEPLSPVAWRIVPDALVPLHNLLKDHFDYWLNRFLNFNASFLEDYSILRDFRKTSPWLPQAIGYYGMVTLGITPASMIKLIDTRTELSYFPPVCWENAGVNNMKIAAADSTRLRGLPEDLSHHQKYDLDGDHLASLALVGFYRKRKPQGVDNIQQLIPEIVDSYFKALYTDIMQVPSRRIKMMMDENHLIKSITLTCQDKQALQLILNLPENIDLMLEINKNHRYFGFPGILIADHGLVVEQILNDVLSKILEFAKLKHPQIGKRETVTVSRLPEVIKDEIYPGGELERKAPNFRKKQRVRSSRIARLAGESLTVDQQQSSRNVNVVDYDKAKIAGLMNLNPEERNVGRVIDLLERVNQGETRLKMIKWSGGKRLVARTGDLRVILKRVNGKDYEPEMAEDREKVYKGYSDKKVK